MIALFARINFIFKGLFFQITFPHYNAFFFLSAREWGFFFQTTCSPNLIIADVTLKRACEIRYGQHEHDSTFARECTRFRHRWLREFTVNRLRRASFGRETLLVRASFLQPSRAIVVGEIDPAKSDRKIDGANENRSGTRPVPFGCRLASNSPRINAAARRRNTRVRRGTWRVMFQTGL